MGWESLLALSIILITVLLLSGVWIPFAIGITGLVLLVAKGGISELNALGLTVWGGTNSFMLTSLPLFVFMAEILIVSGVGQRFYDGLAKLTWRLPGGLLQSNIAGCAMFAAISGSSVATAASIGSVALPQLKSRGYDIRMATGSLAAGGTLGILIPPSGAMILYGTFTETSIVKLFLAGIIPGLLLAAIFMVYIGIRATISPGLTPRDEIKQSWRQVFFEFVKLLPFIGLIGAVLGSMYAGLATPTEAAAIGATAGILISAKWGNFSFRILWDAASRSVGSSCTILLIVAMAFIFSYAINNAQIGTKLADALIAQKLDRVGFLIAIYVMYAILGCIMDSVGMIMITVPLLFPTIVALGIDPIWFGILLVLQVELGQITPPFGINLFVVQGIAKCKLGDVIIGCIPYFFIFIAYVVLITVYPDIVLWLPKLASK